MPEEFITIAEAARRLGKSEKTLRRMVHSGKLTARYPVSNRAEIAISDIEAMSRQSVQIETEAALTERIERLERQVIELQAMIAALSAPASAFRPRAREIAASPSPLPGLDAPRSAPSPGHLAQGIPGDTIRVINFARVHGMSPDTVKFQIAHNHLDALEVPNPSRPGEKIRYFTIEQQRRAVELWQHNPRFSRCKDCPH